MLFRLSSTTYAVWCDTCLRGSAIVAKNAPLVARYLAIESLRKQGWEHAATDDAPTKAARENAERSWTGETYCVDCAASQHLKRGA